jgi:hypothetical protein
MGSLSGMLPGASRRRSAGSSGRLCLREVWPIGPRAIGEPQNEIGGRWRTAVAPQKLCRLRPVPVRVKTNLHEGLRNGALAAWNESALERALEIDGSRSAEPFRFLRLSTCESLDERIKGRCGPGLLLEHERLSQHGEKPESIGQESVVKEFPEFRIGCRGRVLSNGFQERSVRVPLVIQQISQHTQHRARS